MKTYLKIAVSIVVCALAVSSFVSCGPKPSAGAKGQPLWDSEVVQHKNFKDLGNYVIELPDFDDPAVLERSLAALNAGGEITKFGCTCFAKRNIKGEVVFGRNMDLDISQKCAYVYRTSFGKYKNICVTYSPGTYLNYDEVKQVEEIPQSEMDKFLCVACDALNEKGLYIQVDLREEKENTICYGLHTNNGEVTRADGTPWKDLRASTVAVTQLVSQNCATVAEAVEFVKNSYDWYTFTPAPGVSLGVNQNNFAFMIGDANGDYGLLEIAQDQVNFIPYQYGHANFYITPKWNALDPVGAGLGRLDWVSKVITPVETLEEAMDAMKPIMWRNETLWIGESERVTDGSRLHPYNQIRFQDIDGVPQMDWRSEYVTLCPVLDDGRMIITAEMYDEAKKSTYDTKIKEYYDDAIKAGTLVVDDGSFKFNVKGQKLNLDQLYAKYVEYSLCRDLEKRKDLKPYKDEYRRLLVNQDNAWCHDDHNFEAIKAMAYARIHTRRNAEGAFDAEGMSQYDKLLEFYGVFGEKNEKPLRDAADIWTTSLNIGVNCAQKEMKIRFWENDDVIYHAWFD